MNPETQTLTTSSRRGWVKLFVLGTVASLTGPRWVATLLAETTPVPGPAILRLKPAHFPALASPGGSVQLVFNDIVKPFTLNRVAADRFVTLNSVCTHAGCAVGRFIVLDNQMRCPCHGSRYDIEGRVFRDENGESTEPAPYDLGRFATTYAPDSDTVCISIPNLALAVTSISVHQQGPGETLRLKLVFPVTAFSIYEIRHQTDLTAPFNPVSFSKTPGGEANQAAAFPEDDGEFTAFVDVTGPRGFFVVGLRLLPYV